MAVQTVNIVSTAQCVFVHCQRLKQSWQLLLPVEIGSGGLCNNCWFWRTAVNHVRVVYKACVWHPVTTEAGVYQSTLN